MWSRTCSASHRWPLIESEQRAIPLIVVRASSTFHHLVVFLIATLNGSPPSCIPHITPPVIGVISAEQVYSNPPPTTCLPKGKPHARTARARHRRASQRHMLQSIYRGNRRVTRGRESRARSGETLILIKCQTRIIDYT